ncbi:MAG: c-type cytochrome [Burkholderiales bacterium]
MQAAALAPAPTQVAAPAPAPTQAKANTNEPLYTVVDGDKVDAKTLEGFKAWRSMACERCHGAKQEGMVGPSLIETLKRLSKDEFKKAVMIGRPEKGMPNYNTSKTVIDNIDNLYAYLKGRSDGAINPGRLEPIPK